MAYECVVFDGANGLRVCEWDYALMYWNRREKEGLVEYLSADQLHMLVEKGYAVLPASRSRAAYSEGNAHIKAGFPVVLVHNGVWKTLRRKWEDVDEEGGCTAQFD